MFVKASLWGVMCVGVMLKIPAVWACLRFSWLFDTVIYSKLNTILELEVNSFNRDVRLP